MKWTVDPTLRVLSADSAPGGAHPGRIILSAPAGLYQVSAFVDARSFEWESLYETLSKFGNHSVRTGPWDFSINNNNTPLVPSFRVSIDGKPVGLWFFQRVSLENLAEKTMQGRFAFWLREGGEHEIELKSFHEAHLVWSEVRIEPDPEDSLLACAPLPRTPPWHCEDFWNQTRSRLATEACALKAPLDEVAAWAREPSGPNADQVYPALVLWHLHGDIAFLDAAEGAIEEILAMPSWGNPNPDGYSHNGDMTAANCLVNLARAWHLLPDGSHANLKERILECLVRRGTIFLELLLLNRDYWGGSVLQDHGWVSISRFTETALLLHRIIPEAADWVRYAVPRCQRGFAAMPRDGGIPISSFSYLSCYLDSIALLRDRLIDAGERDIYEQHPFSEIVDAVFATANAADNCLSLPGFPSLMGALGFFTQMLAGPKQTAAAKILEHMLGVTAGRRVGWLDQRGFRVGVVDALLVGFNDKLFAAKAAFRPADFVHLPDSGVVSFVDRSRGVHFTTRAGSWTSIHANRAAPGPCDRMTVELAAGHFQLMLRGHRVFVSPDTGYAIRAILRSGLWIDGRGQSGDIGYPMSIPASALDHGRVQAVEPDSEGHGRRAMLDLARSYDDDLGVLRYERSFEITPEHLVITDSLELSKPRKLTWLFQCTGESLPAVQLDGSATLQTPAHFVTLRPLPSGLHALIAPTPVVWSYSASPIRPDYQHFRFDRAEATSSIRQVFMIEWTERTLPNHSVGAPLDG